MYYCKKSLNTSPHLLLAYFTIEMLGLYESSYFSLSECFSLLDILYQGVKMVIFDEHVESRSEVAGSTILGEEVWRWDSCQDR